MTTKCIFRIFSPSLIVEGCLGQHTHEHCIEAILGAVMDCLDVESEAQLRNVLRVIVKVYHGALAIGLDQLA